MSNYWEKRAARQMHNQMQKAEDYARDLAQYYIAASRHLQSEQNAILRRFALTHHMTIKEAEELVSRLKDPSSIKELIKALKKNPGNAEIIRELEAQSARARIMRLNALQDQVTYTTGQIQILLNKKAQKLFVNLARSAYYNTMFDAMQRAGYGFNVKMLDPKRIKRVMDRSWAGSGFSKRLWGNTKALEDAVKREIIVNLLTGRPPIKASQAIDEEFGKGYNNARRLIRTESAYITNQMTLEGYKDLEAEKYIYVAILDLKTSEICRSLDKKRFLVKNAKAGVNYPPMHPWCRSTTIPWMPDSLLKNMKQRALDPKTGKHVLVPGDMTYEQWYKQFVEGKPAGDSTTQRLLPGSGTFAGAVTNGSNTVTFVKAPGTDTSTTPAYKNHDRVRAYRDITKEYLNDADPGRGFINYDEDYNAKKNVNEIATAKWIHDNLGGDIRLRKALGKYQKKDPDYEWMGTLWDLKSTTTENAANSAIRTGMAQIEDNPGGVILNFGNYEPDMAKLLKVIDKRMMWYPNDCADILIISKGKLIKAMRY